jgi:serine/threonine-protein kinase
VPEFVTVLDFGISKIADPSGAQQNITQTGAVIGTPIYMAPEQIMNPKEVDRRVDIYATGVMVYEMLSGRLPYDGSNTAELIVKACTVPPTPLRDVAPDLPGAIIEVVDRAMAREPSGRWQSAAEFADALRRSLGGGHAFPTAPQGSGHNGWAPPNALGAPPVTALPSTTATPATAYAAPSAALPSMATPSHWGALAAPSAPTAFAPPQPPPRRSRTALLAGGVIAALAGLCCVGSIAAGYFATGSSDPSQDDRQGPHMTPLPTPAQQMVPTTSPPAQAPQMVPMGTPEATRAPAAMAPGVGVAVDEPRVVGLMEPDAVERALRAATPAMDRCRVATAQTVTVLAIVQSNGRVVINRPADENTGDPSVAQCVGNRFASQTIDAAGSGGIVTFTAHLAAR